MGFLLVIAGICAVIALLGLYGYISQKISDAKDDKEARESGEKCSVCKQVQAETIFRNNGKKRYVCYRCYNKLLDEWREKQAEARRREIEEKPVELEVKYGTYSYGSLTPGCSDSAGGWDVLVNVTNRSSKDVKYVIAELIPYNTVGDIGYSKTVGAGVKKIRITGPIYGGKKLKEQVAKKFWYDIKLDRVGVGEVKVIFMDGTEKTFRQE